MEQLDQNKKRENLQKEKNQIFRLLPRVDDLMKKENVQRLAEKEGYERVLGAVRDSVENLRNEISQGIKKGISEHEAKEMIQKFLYEIESSSKKSEVNHLLEQEQKKEIQPVYNGTGVILHTGDFKVDYTPLFGEPIDLQRLSIIGKKGVLAVLSDSTNALRPGFTPSETKVAKTFDTLFAEHRKRRIIVATFASNVDRVQQLINTAHKYGRKVILQGRSMETVIEIATDLGYVKIPEKTLISVNDMNRYPDEQLVFITTGSQGEEMAALSRMADGTHRKVRIKPNDTIILSSNPIPGNEKAVSRIINELTEKGANVIFQDTHVSGHACQEELKLIYSLLKPRYAIPVHGEYRHRAAAAGLAKDLGIPEERVMLIQSGDVLELSEEEGRVTGKVTAREVFVDGLGIGDVGNIVIRDRQNLSENGIIVVTLSLEKGTNSLLAGPDIISRGFVYVRESGELMQELRTVALEAVKRCEKKNYREWGKIKGEIRDALDEFLWKKIKRKPVIIPIIMEV